MAVTLRDVAEVAQLSVSTVSRALNRHPNVDAATRALVHRVAREIGYPLERLRQAAQAQTVLVMGAGAPGAGPAGDSVVGTDFAREVFAGVQTVLEPRGIVASLQYRRSETLSGNDLGADPAVLGVILMGGSIDTGFLEELAAADIPFVIAGGRPEGASVDSVMADYERGIEAAVAHLAGGGARKIALVNGPARTVTSSEKYRGFRLGLALYGLEHDPNRVVAAGDFTPRDGAEITEALLNRCPDVDAIIYADDHLAVGGLRVLRALNRRVPSDVSVVGIHDYPVASYAEPPLTTVRFDMQQMGRIAAERLLSISRADSRNSDPWSVLIPAPLVVRSSTR